MIKNNLEIIHESSEDNLNIENIYKFIEMDKKKLEFIN